MVLQAFSGPCEMDMSFLYSYKPVLYPIVVTTFDEQCVDVKAEEAADNSVSSLVSLCCQKIVQVRCESKNIYLTKFCLFVAKPTAVKVDGITF